MTFTLGARSLRNMRGMNPDLIAVINGAIEISTVDFCILDGGGFRTVEMQQALYNKGRFGNPGPIVTQKDGVKNRSNHQDGLAVDLVPWVGGSVSWNWEYVYPIFAAVHAVTKAKKISGLIWGGVWDKKLVDLDVTKLEDEVQKYTIRHAGSDMLDGPHMELRRK